MHNGWANFSRFVVQMFADSFERMVLTLAVELNKTIQ